MKFLYLFLVFLACIPQQIFANQNLLEEFDIKIISREKWGANEEYRLKDSQEWKDIFKAQAEYTKNNPATPEQIAYNKKQSEKRNSIRTILNSDYVGKNNVVETISTYNQRKLIWPIQKTADIKGIVIHHTAGVYSDPIEGVQSIYKFHTLGRKWGDIGYNYIIGENGEIFEGRAGGERAIGAHTLWNNKSNIGISLMGNFNNSLPSQEQIKSSQKLVKYLVKKYNINLSKKSYFHRECKKESCESVLESYQDYNIIGHTDAGHTSCPGDLFYADFDSFRLELIGKYSFNRKKLETKLQSFSLERLLTIQGLLEKQYYKKNSYYLYQLKYFIRNHIKTRLLEEKNTLDTSTFKKNIKVKLSYLDHTGITINNGEKNFIITRRNNKLYLDGVQKSSIKIPEATLREYLEITSWQRIPGWDKNKKYNDNKFRGELIIYIEKGKLVVVNHLKLEDYLKGLGEVSNNDHPEKVKTIIVSARSYAQWYMSQARKFEGKFYDASDDPAVFQKYLGYSLELRSPKVNKIVEESRGQYISYNNQLIKPWYSSRTNGKTRSYKSYCLLRSDIATCKKNQEFYPYLQSVDDFVSQGKTRLGHGVGISGVGSTYFAKVGWSHEMIIKYYLKGVKVSK